MKYFIYLSLVIIFSFSTNINACPYSAMTAIDKKLEIFTDLPKETIVKIVNLRNEGEKILQNGNGEEAEKILNTALALFVK